MARPQPTRGRDPDGFRRAAGWIAQEVHDRTGLDVTEIVVLAQLQELEHGATPERATGAEQREGTAAAKDAARGFDDPQRREQLRARLAAARVPEPAIDARTLADLGQAQEAEQAAKTPVATAKEPRAAAPRRAARQLQRQR